MRKLWWVGLALMTLFGAFPASADDQSSPPDPTSRAGWIAPAPPGTKTTVKLQWGPHVVHPGTDLWRPHADVIGADGFVTGMRPSVRLADGTEPPHTDIHIHHSDWYLRNAQNIQQARWLMSTGEETTHIDLDAAAKGDPRYAQGMRYGLEVHRGELVAWVVSMIHNETAQPMTLWLQLELDFVHGTRDQIRQATALDYRPLSATLAQVKIFNVPRAGSLFAWPRDLQSGTGAGVGSIWTVPFDGALVMAAAHLHPGAREQVVSNLGSEAHPCPDEGDGFPGTTVARLRAFTRNDVFPSQEFQVGVTQPSWRLKVHKGDRLAINAIYDATRYGYVDAMHALGTWADTSEPPAPGESTCSPALLADPNASPETVSATIPNQSWSGVAQPTCTQCDNLAAPAPPLGPHENVITMEGFLYQPGDQSTVSITGVPWVQKGETITFVNADQAAAVRHTATSCWTPCNGASTANYPHWNGTFDSGVLGTLYVPSGPPGTEGYATAKVGGVSTLDTSGLSPGYYPYFCRLHTWMRGAFYVVE